MKKVVPVLSLLMAIYWVAYGLFKYGFWIRKGPGGGFLPVISGILVIVFSLIILISGRKDKSPSSFTWTAFIAPAALLALVLCSYLVGLIISMAIFIFAWLKFIENYRIVKSLTISICCVASIYAIFIVWLNVPMPKGILGIL